MNINTYVNYKTKEIMKKTVISTILLLSTIFAGAQGSSSEEKQYTISDAGLTYTKIITVDGKTASQLYSIADNYFTYNYVDANSVIQTQDREAGTIIGKGLYHNFLTYTDGFGNIICSAPHILRIDCKDGRIRVILTMQEYKLHGIVTDSRPNGFDREQIILTTYPFGEQVAKPNRRQKREQRMLELVNEKALFTLQNIEDYFKKSGSAGVEDNDW